MNLTPAQFHDTTPDPQVITRKRSRRVRLNSLLRQHDHALEAIQIATDRLERIATDLAKLGLEGER